MSPVFVKSFIAPPVDRREALRYAGVRGEGGASDALLDACLSEMERNFCYRVCWCEMPLPVECFSASDRAAVGRRLAGCSHAVFFAATVGIEADRRIARYGRLSESRALMLDALGSERIEALCDAFCAELAAKNREIGCVVTPRFSPGYGDFSLEAQREMVALLDAPRSIGVTLNESLLMTPTKSVTAIVGIKKQ